MSSASRSGGGPDPLTPHFKFHRLLFDESPTMMRELFALRYQVYCRECRFLDPNNYSDELETDEYDPNSVHFTAYNLENQLVGSLRLVLPGIDQRFPVQEHGKELFDAVFIPPPLEAGEVSRLVVRESYRRRLGDTRAGVSQDFLIGSA